MSTGLAVAELPHFEGITAQSHQDPFVILIGAPAEFCRICPTEELFTSSMSSHRGFGRTDLLIVID
jgi:hypothetical protein